MDKYRRLRIGILILLAAAVCAGSAYYCAGRVYQNCIVEAGVAVKPADFFKWQGDKAKFLPDGGAFDNMVPGKYPLRIQCGLFAYSTQLEVIDTTPPEGTVTDRVIEAGERLTAADFTDEVKDVTPVEITYQTEPDFERLGRQTVAILLTDAGGNVTKLQAQLTISKVRMEVTVEAGTQPISLTDFLIEEADAAFLTDVDSIDSSVKGEHKVRLSVDGEEFDSMLHIVDTTPPEAQMKTVAGFTKIELTPEEFVAEDSVADVSEVSISFQEEPDFSKTGTQKIGIILRDASGNETVKTTTLTLQEDTEPPVITGAADLSVMIGDSISYKRNVKVSDNCSRGLSLTVNNAAVNLNAEGSYPVTYTARDASGNVTVKEVTLTVRPKTYNTDEIYAMADRILAQIIPAGAGQYDKALAIFNWVKKNVHYMDHSAKVSWQQGAYAGLINHRGDCYTYAMTSKVLLTRAGIVNYDIAKIPARTMHYWNVVDIGTGPLHFDTTPRLDHPVIFLWTDEQLAAYSAQHKLSHNYDRNVYTIFSAAAAAQAAADAQAGAADAQAAEGTAGTADAQAGTTDAQAGTAGAADAQAGTPDAQAGTTDAQAGAADTQAGAADAQAGTADAQAGTAGAAETQDRAAADIGENG